MLATDDRQLVDAVLAGDSDAFRVLVERESRSVIGSCLRILRDPVEAQDVAQEAFLRAYRSLATFRGEGPFGAWVNRIAARLAVARLVARREAMPLDDLAGDQSMASSADHDPEAHAMEIERRRAVLGAVSALPEPQRDVIVLHYFRDLGLHEISALTGRPVGTVKSRLNRGMATLRERLSSGSAT